MNTINFEVIDSKTAAVTGQASLRLNIKEKNTNYLVHRALIHEKSQQRNHTANTKTRAEISGGGRKPWKQKGTGRARAGSNRSPLWRGGGVIFGPKTKLTKTKINKKERRLALASLIFNLKDKFVVVNNLDTIQPQTKNFLRFLNMIKQNPREKILVVTEVTKEHLVRSTNNLKNIQTVPINKLNLSKLLAAEKIIITQASAEQLNSLNYGITRDSRTSKSD